MAKPFLLPLAFCLLFLIFNASLARRTHQFQQQNQCQLDQIQAREPDNRLEAEAGLIESWNPNHDELQCAGVAVLRWTVEPNGLHLPSYSNAPQLIYIVKGNGVLGTVFPGCPETFEESQQQGQRSQEGQSSFSEQDRHQKVRHFREGDIIAIPAGVAYWTYNNGDSPFVAVALLDTNNHENQLDQNPRRFYLAGNPDDEFEPQQQGRRQQSRREQSPWDRSRREQSPGDRSRREQSPWDRSRREQSPGDRSRREQSPGDRSRREQSSGDRSRREQSPGDRSRRREEERSEGNNVFSGFETRLLAEALNIDEETARKLQSKNDNRNNIVKVKGKLDFVSPPKSREERQREEERERERERERKQSRRDQSNGIEETFCSLRLKENIGDPSRADIYTPQAGRINNVNNFNLPILSHLRLSAERGFLYNNAIYAPHWNLNAHSIVYVIRGRARIQIVDENGNNLLNNEVRQGQLFVIPQNHAVLTQAGSEGFEYIAFKTNENAQSATLAGKLSVFRALPESVISNAFQVSSEQARKLKYNREEATLLSSRRSSSEKDQRRDVS